MKYTKLFGRHHSLNYWPAVADFMLALFMIALALGVMGSVLASLQAVGGLGRGQTVSVAEHQKLQDSFQKLKEEKDALAAENGKLRNENQQLTDENRKLVADNADLRTKIAALDAALPPIGAGPKEEVTVKLTKSDYDNLTKLSPVVKIAENKHLLFKKGSADISNFRDLVSGSIFSDIEKYLKESGKRVNTILIVGHTDRSPVARKSPGPNLDSKLIPMLNYAWAPNVGNTGEANAAANAPVDLRPGSNADLGLMRSVAVRNVLAPLLKQTDHGDIQIRCLSAACGVEPNGEITPVLLDPESQREALEASRRRIEILFLGLQR